MDIQYRAIYFIYKYFIKCLTRYPVGKAAIKNATALSGGYKLKGHIARLVLLIVGVIVYFFPFLYVKEINELYGLNSPKLDSILE